MTIHLHRLRRKVDVDTADPNWWTLQQQIGPAIACSVAADGPHSFQPGSETAVSYTHSGYPTSTDDQDVAAGLAAATITRIGTESSPGDLWSYYETATSASGVLYLRPRLVRTTPPDVHTIGSLTAAGGGSLTLTPDDVWPNAAVMPSNGRDDGILVVFKPVDSSNDPVPDNTSVATITAVFSDPRTGVVGRSRQAVAWNLVEPVYFPIPIGTRFTVHMGVVSSPPGGDFEAYEIYWAPAVVPSA